MRYKMYIHVFQYIVPDKDTTYMCVAQTMPDLGAKHHVIQVSHLRLFSKMFPFNQFIYIFIVTASCLFQSAILYM
jgi:hypothetical protein